MDQNGKNQIKDWSSKTILIADEQFSYYILVRNLLDDTGVKMKWTRSGIETINYCKDNPVDLILIEYILLPTINGVETTKQLLKINSKYKIIASTYNNCEDEFIKAGAVDFIRKPINPDKFIRKLTEQLFKN